jgi:hypothetical protein
MKRLSLALLSLAMILPIGCTSSGSGTTAPSSNPDKPEKIRTLKVKSPSEVSIKQNGTADVDISVDRKNFTGPVEIKFDQLPAGVSTVTPDQTIPADKDSLKVALKAAPDAKVEKDHMVKVMAKAKDLPADSVEFKLEVKLKD